MSHLTVTATLAASWKSCLDYFNRRHMWVRGALRDSHQHFHHSGLVVSQLVRWVRDTGNSENKRIPLAHDTDSVSYIINGLLSNSIKASSWQLWQDSASTFVYVFVKQLPSEQQQVGSTQINTMWESGWVPLQSLRVQVQEKISYTWMISVSGEQTLYTRMSTFSYYRMQLLQHIRPKPFVCVRVCMTAHMFISQHKVWGVNTLQLDAMLQSAGQWKHTTVISDTLEEEQQHLLLCTALISCCMTRREQLNGQIG